MNYTYTCKIHFYLHYIRTCLNQVQWEKTLKIAGIWMQICLQYIKVFLFSPLINAEKDEANSFIILNITEPQSSQ